MTSKFKVFLYKPLFCTSEGTYFKPVEPTVAPPQQNHPDGTTTKYKGTILPASETGITHIAGIEGPNHQQQYSDVSMKIAS